MIATLRTTLASSSRAVLSAAARPPLASTSSALFSSSAQPQSTTAVPRAARKATKTTDGAERLVGMLLDDVDLTASGPAAANEEGSLLSSVNIGQAISPRSLAPERLLDPFPARPDFARGHPLGPPTSAKLTHDPFVRLGISPLASPMNVYLRADFCTSMGKIQPRGKTSLQRSSQRKMAKAVRRARSMGIVATFGRSVPLP